MRTTHSKVIMALARASTGSKVKFFSASYVKRDDAFNLAKTICPPECCTPTKHIVAFPKGGSVTFLSLSQKEGATGYAIDEVITDD